VGHLAVNLENARLDIILVSTIGYVIVVCRYLVISKCCMSGFVSQGHWFIEVLRECLIKYRGKIISWAMTF
jgi:hypothetical protein